MYIHEERYFQTGGFRIIRTHQGRCSVNIQVVSLEAGSCFRHMLGFRNADRGKTKVRRAAFVFDLIMIIAWL